jgi:hypothetical protein
VTGEGSLVLPLAFSLSLFEVLLDFLLRKAPSLIYARHGFSCKLVTTFLFREPLSKGLLDDPASRPVHTPGHFIEVYRQFRREFGSYNSSFITHFALLITQVV